MMERIKALAGQAMESDLAQNLLRDFKSLRALWNWIYMALYVWVCVWTVLHHPQHIPTVLKTTSAVVSIIFSGYVLSKAYETKTGGEEKGEQ
jgi:hypothetical protein